MSTTFQSLQPQQIRECAIYSLTCQVKGFAKSGEVWELRFDSKKADLLRNLETVVEISSVNGVPMSVARGKLWTQSDRQQWLQKYGSCLRDMVEVVNATASGESGMVVLFQA